MVAALAGHLEKVSADADRRSARTDEVLARFGGELAVLRDAQAQLQHQLMQLRTTAAAATSSSSGSGGSADTAAFAATLRQQMAERVVLDTAAAEARLSAVIQQRLSSYSPAELVGVCERRIDERMAQYQQQNAKSSGE